MYPLVLGIAIFSMSNNRILDETSEHLDSSEVSFFNKLSFYGPEVPDFDHAYYSNYNTAISQTHSLAFVKPKGFISFKEALAFKESRGRYRQVNTLGYLGKYQFGTVTLNHFGVSNSQLFLSTPLLQEQVFLKYLNYNHDYLSDHIEKYEGKTIGGIKITESGMLAAAHLSGPGGVRKYLDSNGTRSSKDAYGSSVKHYLKKFAGYDLKSVIK